MIYINANSFAYIDGKSLNDYFTAKGIQFHSGTNLKDVEDDCILSLIDLSQFEDSKVSIKCGAEIGLSDVFKLIIIAVTNPSNNELNSELIGFKAHIFKREDIHLFIKDDKLLDRLKRGSKHLSKMERIDDRIAWRSYLSEDLNELVAKMLSDRKEKDRLASIAKEAANT